MFDSLRRDPHGRSDCAEGIIMKCPNCGDDDWEVWYMKAPWFKRESSGVQAGTADGPAVHWAEGEQTCPTCKHAWWVSDSD